MHVFLPSVQLYPTARLSGFTPAQRCLPMTALAPLLPPLESGGDEDECAWRGHWAASASRCLLRARDTSGLDWSQAWWCLPSREVLTVRREEGVCRREVVTPGSLAWRGHGARMWAVVPTLTLGQRRDFVSKRLATRLAF